MSKKVPSLRQIKGSIVPELMRRGALKAVVFGSYARGAADQFSDLDLIVVADTDLPFVERFKDFWNVWRACPVKAMNLLVYLPDEFEAMQLEENPFISRVLSEGKVIYEAGSESRSKTLASSSGA